MKNNKFMVALATTSIVSGIMAVVVFLLFVVLLATHDVPEDIFIFMVKAFLSSVLACGGCTWLFEMFD